MAGPLPSPGCCSWGRHHQDRWLLRDGAVTGGRSLASAFPRFPVPAPACPQVTPVCTPSPWKWLRTTLCPASCSQVALSPTGSDSARRTAACASDGRCHGGHGGHGGHAGPSQSGAPAGPGGRRLASPGEPPSEVPSSPLPAARGPALPTAVLPSLRPPGRHWVTSLSVLSVSPSLSHCDGCLL